MQGRIQNGWEGIYREFGWPTAQIINFLIGGFNPQSAKLNHLNFHPLEVVSRYRDPQLQVGENYSYLFN